MSLHAPRVGKDIKDVSSGRRKTSAVSRETATPRRCSTGTEVPGVHSVKESSRSRKTACEGSLPPIVFERSPQQGTKPQDAKTVGLKKFRRMARIVASQLNWTKDLGREAEEHMKMFVIPGASQEGTLVPRRVAVQRSCHPNILSTSQFGSYSAGRWLGSRKMATKSLLQSEIWNKEGIIVIDGGLGTEVDDRGFSINDNPLWSASVLRTNPEVVRDIHLDFLRAGAEIHITATFTASVEMFCKHCDMTEDEAKGLIKLAVRLAREACDIYLKENPGVPCPLIAGSVGPYGSGRMEFVKDKQASTYTGIYVDSVPAEKIKDFHRPRIECLLSENVDLLAIEAIPAQLEGELIVEVLEEFPEAKAWVCFNCKNDRETCHGEVFADAIASVSKSDQVIGVGVNCTAPEYVEKLLLSAKEVCNNKPLICYPNSGEVYVKDIPTVGTWKGTRQSTLDHYVPSWVSAGAKAIGGCCRVKPSEIELIKSASSGN